MHEKNAATVAFHGFKGVYYYSYLLYYYFY